MTNFSAHRAVGVVPKMTSSALCVLVVLQLAGGGGEDAAADLIALDRFEEGAEIALAKPVITLALNDLEEDRADDGLGEDLQEQPLPLRRRAIDQDLAALQPREVLA